ncbi:MAG: TIGR03546 family protein [Candidatus Omnitrophica bacterium]|nr:TIGR03546 family protein [Candidatus Omnitrophota bacterium]
MNILKMIIKTLKLLNSNASPWTIAFGMAFGMLIGLTPGFPLHDYLFIFLALFFNVSIPATLFSMLIFSLLSLLLTAPAHALGYRLLVDTPSLTPLWTQWYTMPLLPFTRFYNSVVLGTTLIGLICFIPLLFKIKFLVVYYRKHLQQKVMKWKIMQLLNVGNWLNVDDKLMG